MVKRKIAAVPKSGFDRHLIDTFASPGMRPILQVRSRELVLRLFNEGLDLLQEIDFDGLSVEAVCARAESTVGAFYSRFESKEAFVTALQRIVVQETRARIVADYECGGAPRDTLSQLVHWIATGAVAWNRRYEGLVRASLRRANHDPSTWMPLRELALLQLSYAKPLIVSLLDPSLRKGADARVEFAFQLLHGTINNMVLINPGPFTIHSAETARMLAASMTQFIVTPATRKD